GVKVRTLKEFRDVLSTVDSSVVYLHVVEARGRKGRRRHDFATWVDEQLGLPELAAAMARMNPFPFGLEEVRRRRVPLGDAVLAAGTGRRAAPPWRTTAPSFRPGRWTFSGVSRSGSAGVGSST